MEYTIVSFDIAKKLKDLGFPFMNTGKHYSLNWPITRSKWNSILWEWDDLEPIDSEGILFGDDGINYEYNSDMAISAPIIEIAAKWLRDYKNIYIEISYNKLHKFYDCFITWDEGDEFAFDNNDMILEFDSYDDALLYGIKRSIEILKK